MQGCLSCVINRAAQRKGEPIRSRRSGASLIRSGGAGLLVMALELWALEPAQEVLNPEPVSLLGDQPGDRGGGIRARMRFCRASMVAGSRRAVAPVRAAGALVGAAWGLAVAAGTDAPAVGI